MWPSPCGNISKRILTPKAQETTWKRRQKDCKHQRIREFVAIPCLQEMSKATHKVLPTRVEQGQELFTCQWGPEKIQEASSLHKDACRNQEQQSRLTQGKRARQAGRKEGSLRPRPSYWGCKEKVLLTGCRETGILLRRLPTQAGIIRGKLILKPTITDT